MKGKTRCVMCDNREQSPLNSHDFCDACENEFQETMALVKCARTVCSSPITCKMQKRCLQIKAGIQLALVL